MRAPCFGAVISAPRRGIKPACVPPAVHRRKARLPITRQARLGGRWHEGMALRQVMLDQRPEAAARQTIVPVIDVAATS